jgi:nitrate reductase cytochrome c-type subunit
MRGEGRKGMKSKQRTTKAMVGTVPVVPIALTAVYLGMLAPGTPTADVHGSWLQEQRDTVPPPTIPHEVSGALSRTQECGVCHVTGGVAPAPHAERRNCMQCHVASGAAAPWERGSPAAAAAAAAAPPVGSPPPIPHALEGRDNCLMCHGASAPMEAIRTSHPERESCRQCHVGQESGGTFRRP